MRDTITLPQLIANANQQARLDAESGQRGKSGTAFVACGCARPCISSGSGGVSRCPAEMPWFCLRQGLLPFEPEMERRRTPR